MRREQAQISACNPVAVDPWVRNSRLGAGSHRSRGRHRTDIPVLVVDVPSKPGPGLNGEIVDYRVAVALRAGMSPSLDLRAGQAQAGWAARRLDARRVEITAGSEVFVTTKGHLPPRWLDVVAELGEVFIVYGVGVITATQAPDLVAFTAGCAAAARIAWHTNVGQKPGYHLLDLREAGFALPAFSFPADQLRARGPLEQWRFEHLGNRGRPGWTAPPMNTAGTCFWQPPLTPPLPDLASCSSIAGASSPESWQDREERIRTIQIVGQKGDPTWTLPTDVSADVWPPLVVRLGCFSETSPSRAASTARPRRFRGVNGTQVGRCVTSVGNASGSNRSCCAIRVRGASTWGPMPRAKPATAAR